MEDCKVFAINIIDQIRKADPCDLNVDETDCCGCNFAKFCEFRNFMLMSPQRMERLTKCIQSFLKEEGYYTHWV